MKPPSALSSGISKIIREFKLPVAFRRNTLDEALLLPGEILPEEIARRVDLRDEAIVTIDGETARDFDDAVSVSPRAGGGHTLKVSIADVSYYVRPGTAIDREAFERGTSTYFPDRVLPMLPERLSNDLCSLVPHKDRLTFTAEMEFDGEGRRESSRFYRSVIRSAARLTYKKVRQILVDRDEALRSEYRLLIPDLERMAELAAKIQDVRMKRGSLDFDLPEPLIEVDLEEGTIDRIVKAERNMAHRLIEEFMIAANEAVAEFVTENDSSTTKGNHDGMIYRIHGEPDPEKARDFRLFLHNLGLSFHLGRKIQPKTFAGIIEAVRGRPEERLVNTLLLRTMKQAIYDTRNVGHFGLASGCYTHFTSPIRRYPDLAVHRVLGGVLEKRGSHRLRHIASHSSERERNSMKAEWASRDLAAALFMKRWVGKSFEGIISNVTKFGFFVKLKQFFVEGLVPVRSLTDDFYVFHEKAHLLMGKRRKVKYQIGMPVSVRVNGVNEDKRWIDFEIIEKKLSDSK